MNLNEFVDRLVRVRVNGSVVLSKKDVVMIAAVSFINSLLWSGGFPRFSLQSPSIKQQLND